VNTDIRVAPGDWDTRVEPADGPQLVVGGPGTGKTAFLVRRATRLIERGEADAMLVLSFSRRGADDLDARIRSASPGPTRAIDVSTYHSFAARLIETHAARRGWEHPPTILPGPDQKQLIAELLERENPDGWSPAYRPLLTTRTFADEVTDFILRCREELIGPTELAERRRADWRGLPEFLDRYDRELRRRSVVDYGTLLAEAAELLLDPTFAEEVASRYRHVLVDEYQDATRAQSLLLRRLVEPHGRITAAADPYQSIYSFRGADIENVSRFPDDFAHRGRRAERLVLTTSFRVPAAILDAAVRITAHELPGAAGKVAPAPGSGSVEVYRFTQQIEEAEWVAAEIERLNLERRVPYDRIAVFTRSKTRFLAPLSRSLEHRGIPHDTPDTRLVDQPAIRFVFDLVAAATATGSPGAEDRFVRRILLGPMFTVPSPRVAELAAARSRDGTPWPDLVRTGVPDGDALAGLLDDPSWANAAPAVEGLWRVWSTLPQISGLVTDPNRAEDRAAWSSFAQVLSRWRERTPGGTLVDYRFHSDAEDFEASPLLSYRPEGSDRVTVTTLHQAKGLDFDVVFIADAVEGVFPDLRTKDSLLGTRHLQSHLPADTAGYLGFRLQEERRLAYTAMTRATRRVVWTATDSGFDVDGGTPSRFLPLAAGVATVAETPTAPGGDRRPITAGQYESHLRRIAADPFAPPPERLAAVDTLATGRDLGLRNPDRFAGAVSRGSDVGVFPVARPLSPSRAEAYERCPRAYVLEQALGIGSEPTAYSLFGTLIHAILEEVEAAASGRGDHHATLDEALAALDTMFVPGAFGGGPYDAAWYERAREALENLYTLWPGSGPPAGLEVLLELERDGTRWRGRADRIEQRGDGLVVVDYKTGRTVSRDEAATSLQLGFYLIAAREDPVIGGSGPVTGAEMWFPRAPLKRSLTTRSFDATSIPDVEVRMAAVAAGIRDERWTPTPGEVCKRCRVRRLCPAVAEGEEAFVA